MDIKITFNGVTYDLGQLLDLVRVEASTAPVTEPVIETSKKTVVAPVDAAPNTIRIDGYRDNWLAKHGDDLVTLWNRGLRRGEIAGVFGLNVASLGMMVSRGRKLGLHLPYRKTFGAAAVRREKFGVEIAKRKPGRPRKVSAHLNGAHA